MAGSQTFRGSCICQHDNGTAFIFDWSYADPNPTATHLDTGIAAGNLETLMAADVLGCLPSMVSIYKWRFATVTGPFAGEIGYVVPSPPSPGGRTVLALLPQENAVSLKRNTGHAARSDRGRLFFGPIDASYQDLTNFDKVNDDGTLMNLALKMKASLTVSSTVLTPCLLNSAGEWNGHAIINVSVAEIFVQRKTRRFRTGV
jgi:hypothetical protein